MQDAEFPCIKKSPGRFSKTPGAWYIDEQMTEFLSVKQGEVPDYGEHED